MNKERLNPFNICHNFLQRRSIVYKINLAWKDKILESLKLMDQTIVKIEKGESIDDFKFSIIEEILNLLTSLTSDKILDEDFKSFIHAYIFLAHNINENTFKYPGVTKKIEYLQRYTENCLTIYDIQNLLKRVSNQFSSATGETPSFRLSRHYYDLIKSK
jgi:hypothetical protein